MITNKSFIINHISMMMHIDNKWLPIVVYIKHLPTLHPVTNLAMITRKKLTITEYSCYKIRQRRAYLILFQKEMSLGSRKQISLVTPLTYIHVYPFGESNFSIEVGTFLVKKKVY